MSTRGPLGRGRTAGGIVVCCLLAAIDWSAAPPRRRADAQPAATAVVRTEPGRRGGSLVVAERAEPRTLNPVLALDNPSRAVLRRMTADLIHINRATHQTEPELAESWTASRDGRTYTIRLRPGLRFSDGHACTVDDVVFTFAVYLDEAVHSPQRDLLIVGGKPLRVTKLDARTVRFELAAPSAAAERIFDSIAILPKHLLEQPYRDGTLATVWSLSTPPQQMAGLGPYRLQQYVPGDRIVLERNPYYWKFDRNGTRLPYLDRLTILIVPSDDTQAIRFRAAELDVVNRLSAENYSLLARAPEAGRYELRDAGPGLEYNFLFFNLNELAGAAHAAVRGRQHWFKQTAFRQAVSAAIDRDSMVRLVYQGRATPLAAHVTAGNRLWMNTHLPAPARSLERARALLKGIGFSWRPDGRLVDDRGTPVEFTVVVAANNAQRMQMATILQEDLRQLGLSVQVVPLDFRALLDRVTGTREYDACVLGLGSGDVDPTADMNVWTVTGATHLWNLAPAAPAAWELEIDRNMRRQAETIDPAQRKQLYDRVQAIVAEQLPLICLVSPSILVGAARGLANFQPAVLEHYTLWNIETLYWTSGSR
jgi:peptide/nickel transport system substrate-binding protein